MGAAAGLTSGVALASKFKGTAGEKAIAEHLCRREELYLAGSAICSFGSRKKVGNKEIKKQYGEGAVQATDLYLEDILEPSDYASLRKKASLDYEQEELRKANCLESKSDNSNLRDVYDSEKKHRSGAEKT